MCNFFFYKSCNLSAGCVKNDISTSPVKVCVCEFLSGWSHYFNAFCVYCNNINVLMHFFSDQSGQLSLNQSCVTLGKEVIIGSRGTIGNEEAFKLYFVHFPVEELAVIDF